ncbi:MAG: hypothetical protein R2815_11550 [Flavobacteriales bacterium]
MRIRLLVAIPALLWLVGTTMAQKPENVLFKPVNWFQVRYDHENDRFYNDQGEQLNEEYWTFASGKGDKSQRWTVFTDRAGVLLRSEPQAEAAPTSSAALPFAQVLYVFKEEKGWLLVGRESNRSEGWCDKRHLVLWDKPLAEHRTRIELKAFLVNTLTGIGTERGSVQGDLKQKYEVFDGPGSRAERRETNYLYDVFYIYKYDKEGERWLIGPNEIYSQSPLLGWVNARKVKVWATRLCLEPNWEEAAKAERREKNVRARLLPWNSTQVQQRAYLQSGNGEGLVDGDESEPAFDRSGLTGDRMDARLFRYPVLGAQMEGDANCRFFTGVSGVMNVGGSGTLEGFRNGDYLRVRRYYEALREQKDVLCVVFVLEGSADMRTHIGTVKETIAALQQECKKTGMTARYGVVQYFNEYASDKKEPESAYMEQLPLTNDAMQVLEWLDKRICEDRGDKSEARAAYLALARGMAMMEKGRTNVLVHLCSRPDNGRDDPTFGGKSQTDPTDLVAGLEMGRATHYLGYVLSGGTTGPTERKEAFNGMAEDVMPELSTAISNQLKGIVELARDAKGRALAPTVARTKKDGSETARMDQFHFMMKATMLADGTSDLPRMIVADVANSVESSRQALAALEGIVDDRSMIKDHAPSFSYFYGQLTAQDGVDRETLDFLAREKVHVFTNAATWHRVTGMQHPLFRYVLFYDDRSLNAEIIALDELIRAMETINIDESREQLRTLWRKRAQDVIGSKYSDKVPLDEVRAKMMGVHDLNMVKPFEDASLLKGLTLNDLDNKTKFNQTVLDGYKKAAIANKEALNAIKTQGQYYQAPGHEERKDERRYYWIPIEYLFN